MRQTSLRAQLTRASMLTTSVVLLVCAAALLAHELLTYRNSWVDDLRTQADLIAHSTVAALVFGDPKAAQENLSLLHVQSRVSAAVIYTAEGTVFASYVRVPGDAVPLLRGALPSVPSWRFEGPLLMLDYPIERDGERVGAVSLRARHDVWARVGTYALILAGVMLGGLLLAYLVFGRLLGRVTRPLQQMTDVAQEVMASRNWTLRAPATEYQDIGVLVSAFNGMLAEVETRTREIEVEMAERVVAERELRLADRRKDEFLAMLGHELRNPLAPMTTALVLMRSEKASAAAREKAVEILQRQVAHMVRLIDDLLDVSRITMGKLALQREAVELAALLRSVVELAHPMAQHKSQALSLVLPAGGPAWVWGDPARLSQVFSNLLNNACRYTPAGGRIEVALAASAAGIEVGVSDNGIGVAPEIQGRIFDMFEQGDKSLERGNAGLGIGLTLARQLARLHGGDIRVYSEGAGRGARFTVSLPAAPAHALPTPTAAAPPADELGGLRILIADDNVDFAESLAEVLRSMGPLVDVVHDGASAVSTARQELPHVVLLDVGMPKLNGYDAARALREDTRTRDLTLIAITGWGQAADKAEAEAAGFDHHLVKPVDPDRIVALLRRPVLRARGGGSR